MTSIEALKEANISKRKKKDLRQRKNVTLCDSM